MTAQRQDPPRGRLLVVDDEAPVVRLLQQVLTQQGYEVHGAENFAEVRRLAAQVSFDLVTLDIMMPDASGLQILQWLKERHPDVGVVMATALDDVDTVIEAMRLGAYSYLLKPFKLELITAEIERAMERQRLVAENRSYQLELEQKVEAQTRELRAAYAQLERKLKEQDGRDRLLHFQMSNHTLKEACEEILQVVAQVLEVERAMIYRPDAEGRRLEVMAALGLSRPGRLEDEKQVAAQPAVPLDDESTLVAQIFRNLQPQCGLGREVAVPLLYGERALGVLWAEGPGGGADEEACNSLWRLGQEAALVLWAAQVAEDLESGHFQADKLLELE